MFTRGPTTHVALRRYFSQSLCRRRADEARSTSSIDQLFEKPAWSVSSLLPDKELPESSAISPKQLRHLLRLSALPPPKNDAEEAKMLETLASQLHFVKAIQDVDTTGVEPLRSIRDETTAGRKEAEIGLDALKDALAAEETIGVYHKRIRRRRGDSVTPSPDKWDVLGNAEKKVGRYFIVEGGKD